MHDNLKKKLQPIIIRNSNKFAPLTGRRPNENRYRTCGKHSPKSHCKFVQRAQTNKQTKKTIVQIQLYTRTIAILQISIAI